MEDEEEERGILRLLAYLGMPLLGEGVQESPFCATTGSHLDRAFYGQVNTGAGAQESSAGDTAFEAESLFLVM